MFRKLSTMAIVAIMLFISVSMVSFNVSSENVPGPFADRSDGYPQPAEMLDQQQTVVSVNTLDNYMAQSFKAGITGDLTTIGVSLSSSGTGFMRIEIWNSVADLPTGGPLASGDSLDTAGVSTGLNYIALSNPVPVVAGSNYCIVLDFSIVSLVNWRASTVESYIDGKASGSTDGIAWGLRAAGTDWTFQTFVTAGKEGLKKVAWHPDGKYALAVAGDDTVYRYDREITTWSIEGVPSIDYIFHDIVWDDFYNQFYLVGQNVALSRGGAYKYDGTTFENLFITPSSSIL